MKRSLALAPFVAALICSPAFAGTNIFKIYAPGLRAPASASSSTTYATLNPGDEGSRTTLSNSNLTSTSYGGSGVRANMGKSSGKWYWEVTLTNYCAGGVYPAVAGIVSASTPLTSAWNATPNYSFYATNVGGYGRAVSSGGTAVSFGTPATAGEVVGIALDLNAMSMTIYENGVSQGVAFTSIPAGTWFPYVSDPNSGASSGYSCSATVNFGQNSFSYAPPAGYNAGWYQ
jgi:hypothetical protein